MWEDRVALARNESSWTSTSPVVILAGQVARVMHRNQELQCIWIFLLTARLVVRQGAIKLLSEIWLRVFRGDHWHRHEICVGVAVDEYCIRSVGHHAECVCTVCLGDCSLMAKPFSLLLKKVRTVSIVGWTNLQCLQEANAPGPQNKDFVTTGQSSQRGNCDTAQRTWH